MNLIERFDSLTTEQQAMFGRMMCAHAMNVEALLANLPVLLGTAGAPLAQTCSEFMDAFVPVPGISARRELR